MDEDERLRAYLRLHLADGVGAVLFRRLVETFGSAAEAASAGPEQWRRVQGIGEKTAGAIASVTDEQIDAELAAAKERGVRMLCDTDESYPPGLKEIYDSPPVLYVRGSLEAADAVALGVVGARRCTHYGLEQAERFGELLGRAGFTVISGGARGIDTAAHRGALAGGGRTVAVMGCGLNNDYPPENAELFEQIIADGRGALVSELPMATAIMGRNFPMRNRIISGMSLGVLVVEAGRRSGALITAREAADQNREVFAVPGRVDSPTARGVNELIRDGAILVQGLEDVLDHLGAVGAKMTVGDESPADFAVPAELTETEASLLEALSEGPLTLDELVRRSEVAGGKAIAAMTMLVLKGAATQRPGNVFARRRRQAPPDDSQSAGEGEKTK